MTTTVTETSGAGEDGITALSFSRELPVLWDKQRNYEEWLEFVWHKGKVERGSVQALPCSYRRHFDVGDAPCVGHKGTSSHSSYSLHPMVGPCNHAESHVGVLVAVFLVWTGGGLSPAPIGTRKPHTPPRQSLLNPEGASRESFVLCKSSSVGIRRGLGP
jgi:hypothetical protein